MVTRMRIYANPKHLVTSYRVLHFIFHKVSLMPTPMREITWPYDTLWAFKKTENKNIDNKIWNISLCFVHRVFSWSGTWTGRVRPRMGCRPGSETAGRRDGRGGRPPAGTRGPAGPHPGRTSAASLHNNINHLFDERQNQRERRVACSVIWSR